MAPLDMPPGIDQLAHRNPQARGLFGSDYWAPAPLSTASREATVWERELTAQATTANILETGGTERRVALRAPWLPGGYR